MTNQTNKKVFLYGNRAVNNQETLRLRWSTCSENDTDFRRLGDDEYDPL